MEKDDFGTIGMIFSAPSPRPLVTNGLVLKDRWLDVYIFAAVVNLLLT